MHAPRVRGGTSSIPPGAAARSPLTRRPSHLIAPGQRRSAELFDAFVLSCEVVEVAFESGDRQMLDGALETMFVSFSAAISPDTRAR